MAPLVSIKMEFSAIATSVRRAQSGDKDAWNEIVDEFGPTIWTIVRSFGLNDMDASDAQAAVWLRLLTRIDTIREPERLAGWLRTTARHEALAVIRKRARTDATDPENFESALAATPDPAESVVINDDVRQLREALTLLDAKCQQLLRLLYGEPLLSFAEIAEVLGRPIGSIGPTRARCLEKLKRLMP